MKLLHLVADLALAVCEWLIIDVPGGLGRRIRYVYYKRRLKRLGKGVVFDIGVKILNPAYVSIADNTWIDNYVVIVAGPPAAHQGPLRRKPNPAFTVREGEVVIGRNCHVAMHVVLQGHGGIFIGDNCGIASGSLLYSMSHHYSNPNDPSDLTVYKFTPMAPSAEQSLIVSPVVMENNTALGLNSVMLPGATIHEGSWVGTNSTVFKPIPPFSIASGVPAVVVSARRP